MKLSWYRHDLSLKHPFTIARGTRTHSPVVIVELEHEGIVGLGEAAPSARYGESVETVEAFFAALDVSAWDDPFELERILGLVDGVATGNSAAKAAIDLALHDWIGKKLNVPLYRLWGLHRDATLLTSYTIGIAPQDILRKKVREAGEYPVLKIKLGAEDDREIVRTIREETSKPLRIDANEGWKTREVALDRIRWLEQEGVEFVEQPMPAEDLAGTAWLRERSALPLIADESSLRLHDIPRLQGVFDGINIKLMKCTGLREATRMIHAARACALKVMVGCMIETSVAITAAAHLTPLLDYADLDGNILTTNDPFDGVTIDGGRLKLPDRPGIGVIRRTGG